MTSGTTRTRRADVALILLVLLLLTATFAMYLVPYAWGLVAKAVILVVAVYLQRARIE